MITKELFGLLDGQSVYKYTVTDGGESVSVLDYGGIVQSLYISDKNGKLTNVVLGYNSVEDYIRHPGYLGAAIGRVGNRIEGARFFLNEQVYSLYKNNGDNHLHGGLKGFNSKIFTAKTYDNTVELKYTSPDGEEGYPGNLDVTIKYTFLAGALKIEYSAVTDKTTPVNLTNHSYFNLNGAGSGDVLEHTLTIDADAVTPTDGALIPRGGFLEVGGTDLDFKKAKRIGDGVFSQEEQIKQAGGYDINYCLNGGGYRKGGEAVGDKSGITMEFYTDKPGVQLYTGNYLNNSGEGYSYGKYGGFCLETQFYPNGVNYPKEYGFNFLEKGDLYNYTTEYRFSAKKDR